MAGGRRIAANIYRVQKTRGKGTVGQAITEAHGGRLARCPDPAAFERGNYMRMLQNWRA